MKEDTARERLLTLKEEALRCIASLPSTRLGHGMLIIQGRSPSSKVLEETWRRFTESNFLPPPLSRGSYRREIGLNGVETCLFGEIGKAELDRFISQARAIRLVAIDHLSSRDVDFGQIPRGLDGLTYLLYRLAWDLPETVTYSIETFNWLDKLSDPDRSPFASRESFESWEVGKLKLSPGCYFARLSMDIRSCTVGAIDAMLGMSTPRKKASPRQRPSLEARNKWLYELAFNKEITYQQLINNLKEHPEWPRISTIQGVRHAIRDYAKRHGLPEPPPRQS
jgi:hypothetical protein